MSASIAAKSITPTPVALVRAPLLSRVGALNNEAVPHIGLAYIAGFLNQNNCKTTIVDGIALGLNQVHPWPGYEGFQIQGVPLSKLITAIPSDTQVIGFTSMFSAEWVLVRELIYKVRIAFPHALLVAGGEHFTALPEYCLRDCSALDVIVKGEGEATVLNLIEQWQRGNYSQVQGICYLAGDGRSRTTVTYHEFVNQTNFPGRIGPLVI